MGQSTDAHVSTGASESIDSLIAAVAAAPAQAPPSGPLPVRLVAGARVGRYTLRQELGRGGMGTVWEGVHEVTGKRVALKIVRDGLQPTDEIRERFLREARLTTAVRHPGVVPVHDVFDAGDGRTVLVMELLRGETLGRYLRRQERTLRETAGLLADVMEIVAAAHRAGVVHRDLKPENIFLCEASEPGPRVRVLDFGIARLLEPDGAPHDSLTDTGTLLGTPQYMAPEQLFGDKNVDRRADVWALGVILYEAIAGHRPIRGSHLGRIVRNLSEEGVPRPDPAVFPVALAAAVRGMLEIEPSRRTSDLDVVERTLRACARGEIARGTRKGRWVIALALGGVVAVAGVVLHRASPSVAPADTGQRRAGPSPGASAAAAPSREISVATLASKASPAGRALEAFRKALALRSHDGLTMSVRWPGPSGVHGGERSLLGRLRTEQIDGATLGSRSLPMIHSSAAAAALPGVLDSWNKVDSVREQLREPLRAGFRGEGYRLLAWQDEGCQRIVSRGRPVRRVSDLSARRVAAIDADPIATAIYSVVPRAVTVAVADSEIAQALLGGPRLGVDAVVASAAQVEQLGGTRSLEYMTMMPVVCTSGALVVRENVYARLDAESQAVLDEASARLEYEGTPRARRADTLSSLRLGRVLTRVEPNAAERREWQRAFATASRRYVHGTLAAPLAEQVVALSREIDALE